MRKKIILCADDYAQNDAISDGIRRAVAAGRINAVSCLTTAPRWPQAGLALSREQSGCFVGLHLNLTWGYAQSIPWKTHYGRSFKGLLAIASACYLGRMDRAVVDAECHAQLDAFRRVMGKDPDFIDGHQHVHQFPVVRDVLRSLHVNEALTSFVRVTVGGPRVVGFPKAQLIAGLGGGSFKRALIQSGIPVNTSFSGVYPFRQARHYRRYFKQFLLASEDRGLIMCHPGMKSNNKDDPLHASRHHELTYLMSDAFLHDLDEQSFELQAQREEITCRT